MLSVCMIVKNEEKYLRKSLLSVQGVADEIIVVDTGSTDSTVKIAEEFNCRLYHFNWIDDFSAARNYSLDKANGNWILYLDADERLSPNSVSEIKKISASTMKCGYRCKVLSIDEQRNHPSVMSYVRLFPADKKIRFSGKVHEQIEFSLQENKIPVKDSTVEIIHEGYNVSDDELKQKAERNIQLLLKEYEINPSGYYAFQIGQTFGILKRNHEAEEYFLKALDDKYLRKEYRGVAYRFLAINAAERKDYQSSLILIEKSISADNKQPLALMAAAKIYNYIRLFDKAAEAVKTALVVNRNSVNKNYSTAQNILMSEEEIILYGIEIAQTSMNRDLLKFLFANSDAAKRNYKIKFLHDIFEGKQISDNEFQNYLSSLNEIQINVLCSLLQNYIPDKKVHLFEMLAVKCPSNTEVLINLGKAYQQVNRYSEAVKIFEEIVSTDPDNPSIYFYLISASFQNQNINKALEVLETALRKFQSNPEVIQKLNIISSRIAAHIQ